MDATHTLTIELPRPNPTAVLRLLAEGPFGIMKTRLGVGASLTIGSGSDADFRVPDARVSGLHCRLSREAGLVVEDLSSRNGVIVRGARVERAELLGAAPEFRIGDTTMRVVSNESEPGSLGIFGKSEPARRLRDTIQRYASAKAPVLVLGESGTGKDLVARALHAHSGRTGSYFALNVATLPDTLVDAELFGHAKGSFTGALFDRPGAFASADGGTLFLDEVADLSLAAQAKLLRVVEDGIVRPVGAKDAIQVDTRIVAATCADLRGRVKKGAFRLDLYHRLGALIIEVPPLKDRRSDIPLLVDAFLSTRRAELGDRSVDERGLARLMRYNWPGNVRELFAVVYRAALHSPSNVLSVLDFAIEPASGVEGGNLPSAEEARRLVLEAGSVSAAARLVGIPRTTFRTLLGPMGSSTGDSD